MSFVRALLALVFTSASIAAVAGTQLVVPNPTSSTLTPGSALTIAVGYNSIAPADDTLSGISFRMHWDSRRLQFGSVSGVLSTNLVAVTAPQTDDENFDEDPNTDRYVLVSWDSENASWPGGPLPRNLYTANFTTTQTFSTGTTAIRFSGRVTALDYDFAANPVVVTGVPAADTVPPTITLLGGDVTLIQGQSYVDAGATALDARDGNITGRIILTGAVNTNVPGTYVLSYDVLDLGGNAATTVTRTVTVLPPDVTPPTLTPPGDFSIEATSANGVPRTALTSFLAAATANDLRYGTLPVTNDAPAAFPLGDTVVTFSATDDEGNTGTAQATVSVVDTTAPVISGAANVAVEAAGPNGTPATLPAIAAALAAVTAIDIVSGNVVVSNDAPSVFPLGPTTVTFSALDGEDNQSQVQLVVRVGDATPPTITVGANVSAEAVDANGTPSSDPGIATLLASGSATDSVDGTVSVTNNAPSTFPIGTTMVTFTATDVAGNSATATRQVTVGDSSAPTVTPPANVTVVETGAAMIPRSAAIFQAFLTGASATDAVDPNPVISNDAPNAFPTGSTVVTFTATDEDGNQGTATASVTVLVAGTGDQDGDGMSDQFEVAGRLDPNSPTDADDDPDGDFDTNLEEFQNGTDPRVDNTVPVVTPPADITVNAIGPLTPVSLGANTATATDARDGNLSVSRLTTLAPALAPGRYAVDYRATDPAGNVATAQQFVNVVPLIALGARQSVSEGQTVLVEALLNGDAAVYPVTVPFTVGGSATGGSDHDLVAGTVTITEGRRGAIMFTTTADQAAEAEETVVVTLGTPANAVLGTATSTTVTIVAGNVAPVVDIGVAQGATLGQRVLTTGGNVTATAFVSDANAGDTATFDWSGSDAAIPATNGTTSATYVFNPNVAAGLYRLTVRVTDGGGASTTQAILVDIMAAAPTLSTTADTDGDGIVDATDGFGDNDGDGVPNFQDPLVGGEVLQANANRASFLLATEPGLDLQQGQTAFVSDLPGAQLALADITARGGANGGSATTTDTGFAYDLAFYDFVIEGVAPGSSVSVVVPQSAALPGGTLVYRKFTPTGGFANFVVDANNAVRSAPGQLGVCPGVGAAAYVTGLTTGHFCVQLTIQDGGPNDADRAANGRVVDPGSVARQLPPPPPPEPPPPPPNSSSGGGGGCAVGAGDNSDPTLPILALGALAYLLRRRFAAPSGAQ